MHQYFHTTLGFCLWDILALIVFVALVVVLGVHIYKQKKRQKAMEEELAAKQSKAAGVNPAK